MKKIALALALFCCVSSYGQSIKVDTVYHYRYVSINPVTTLDGVATRLYAYLIGDDLSTSAKFYYELRDEDSKCLYKNNIELTPSQYSEWNANTSLGSYKVIADYALGGKIQLK